MTGAETVRAVANLFRPNCGTFVLASWVRHMALAHRDGEGAVGGRFPARRTLSVCNRGVVFVSRTKGGTSVLPHGGQVHLAGQVDP